MPDTDPVLTQAKQTSAATLSIDDIAQAIFESVEREVAMALGPLRERIAVIEARLAVKSAEP